MNAQILNLKIKNMLLEILKVPFSVTASCPFLDLGGTLLIFVSVLNNNKINFYTVFYTYGFFISICTCIHCLNFAGKISG